MKQLTNVQSTERPLEYDTESSDIYVYVNTNIKEEPETEDTPKMYVYNQMVLTKDEFNQYMINEELKSAILELAELLGGE